MSVGRATLGAVDVRTELIEGKIQGWFAVPVLYTNIYNTRERGTEGGEDPELVRRLRQVVLIDRGPVRRGPARNLQRQAGAYVYDRPVPGEGELPEAVEILRCARVLRDVGARARR